MKYPPEKSVSVPGTGILTTLWKSASARLAPAILALALFATIQGTHAQTADRAVVGDRLVLSGSIKEIASDASKADAQQAALLRPVLNQAELNSRVGFEVGLQMRDLDKLQQRLGAGETVTLAELEAQHLPSEADFGAVAKWLTGQGFTITQRDGHRLALFASGTVSQVQTAFQTRFAQVAFEGENYLSAVTAPSVPARLSGVLGVFGLQPFLHAHTFHPEPVPAADGFAYYYVFEILLAYNFDGSNHLTGAGQEIGIIIDVAPLTADLTKFWSDNDIDQSLNNFSTENTTFDGTKVDTRGSEETLDTEWSSGVASGAAVHVYVTGNLDDANLDAAYSKVGTDKKNGVRPNLHQLSMSYGATEKGFPSSLLTQEQQYFATIASYGVSIFASSGDNGAFGASGSTVSVSYPSSDPNITGVGGTTLLFDGNGVAEEVAWSADGTGFSDGRIASSGGGTSSLPRPSWQVGSGVLSSGTHRLVPDVSSAADGHHGAYLIYTDPKSGKQGMYTSGGTSWSSPTWAGICALLNQARANANLKPLGLLNPHIYPLIGRDYFRDITEGSNGHYNENDGYSAKSGYDQVTGIGTPDIDDLITELTTKASGTKLAFGTSKYSIDEEDGTLTVHVLRSGGSAGDVTVKCETSSGTAKGGTDYSSVTQTLVWASGDTAQKAFKVPIKNRSRGGGDGLQFSLKLSSPSTGASLGSPSTATVTIK